MPRCSLVTRHVIGYMFILTDDTLCIIVVRKVVCITQAWRQFKQRRLKRRLLGSGNYWMEMEVDVNWHALVEINIVKKYGDDQCAKIRGYSKCVK